MASYGAKSKSMSYDEMGDCNPKFALSENTASQESRPQRECGGAGAMPDPEFTQVFRNNRLAKRCELQVFDLDQILSWAVPRRGLHGKIPAGRFHF